MLKIIEPKLHHLHEKTINSFLELLEKRYDVHFPPHLVKKSTFIIGHCHTCSPSAKKAEEKNTYGGAILYPQRTSHHLYTSEHQEVDLILQKLFSILEPKKKQTFWTARIAFMPGHDILVPFLDKLNHRHQFYQQLYKAFMKFGRIKKVHALGFALRLSDTSDIDTYKKYWPSLLEVRPPQPSNDYFYGLLSLKRDPFKARVQKHIAKHFPPCPGDIVGLTALKEPETHEEGRKE